MRKKKNKIQAVRDRIDDLGRIPIQSLSPLQLSEAMYLNHIELDYLDQRERVIRERLRTLPEKLRAMADEIEQLLAGNEDNICVRE